MRPTGFKTGWDNFSIGAVIQDHKAEQADTHQAEVKTAHGDLHVKGKPVSTTNSWLLEVEAMIHRTTGERVAAPMLPKLTQGAVDESKLAPFFNVEHVEQPRHPRNPVKFRISNGTIQNLHKSIANQPYSSGRAPREEKPPIWWKGTREQWEARKRDGQT